MPEVTDPDLLAALNGSAAPAGPIYGAPDPNMAFKVQDQALQYRGDARASNADARAADAAARASEADRRSQLEWQATHNPDGSPKAKGGKSLADGAVKRIEGGVGQYSALAGSLGGFKDDYAGNILGNAENMAQGLYSGIGTEGQRNWWANFRSTDNVIRNELFGAALTPAEKSAYEATTIDPSLDPKIVRENLSKRSNILKTALDRQRRFMLANGYNQEAVDILYEPLRAMEQLEAQPTPGEEEEGLTGSVTDDTPTPSVTLDAAPPTVPGTSPGGGERGNLMDLAKQGVTLGLADEAAGVGGYLSGFLTGEDPQAAYTRERDIARGRVATARQDYPVLGTAAEFLGGGAAARIAAPVGNALASVVRQGAALGGAAGYGYGEGAQGSVTNALAGAAGGAALGGALYGAGRGVSAIANRRGGPPPTAEQLALLQAGERQGVPVRQPDVRPELRNQMANAETTQTGGPMIREARANDANLIEQRVAEVGGQGAPADPYALGTQVQEAGRRYIANTRTQANSLYDRARQAAGDARVQPTEALAAVDQNIAELRAAGENSNSGQIAYLEGLRQDLSNPLSIEAVQNLRTNMRGQLSERGLTGTDAERRVAQVIDAANQDLTRELPQGASSALRAADTFYKERQGFINDTLNQIMGTRGNPLPAEQAASRLVSMTKGGGNYQRFSPMWKQLEPTEQADVAATVAESLGRKRNGEFSISTLVQSLDPAKGINPRTARLIFGDDGAQALSDLRLLAKTKTDVQASLNNSRTGTAVNAASGGLKNLLLSGLGFSTGGVGGAVAVPVAGRIIANLGEKRAARMLLNPDFTKWLKNAPNTTNPRVIDQYFSRLAGINSVASNDNQAFVSAMRDAFSKSPGAAAAQDDGNSRREPPAQ